MKLKTSTYNQFQSLCWTEDNRLQAVKDNKMGAYYNYDAAGERNLKLTGGIINVTQNGQSVYAPVFDQQTLYASALVTVNDKGYTKHYFEEGKRICSKIGSGELKNVFDPVPKIEKSYEEQRDIQVEGIHTTYSQCMDISPYIKNGNLYENIINKYTTQVNSGEPIFYYHSDHLGSASYITDSSGIQTQQLVYLPFGEDWVDMKYNTSQYDTPYKFNGKEKDEETGYNYYGARYYYDWASIWLSVDPLSDKLPHLTSYNYCANNPVILFDPDGRYPKSILKYNSKLGGYKYTQSATHLLSLVTGVSKYYIDNTIVYKRQLGRIRPFENMRKDGGGAITLGRSSLGANITFTENFFADDPKAYNNNGYGQNVYEWLALSSHEIKHVPQIDQKGGLWSYVSSFIKEYAENHPNHYGGPAEQEAEASRNTFYDFNSFVNKRHGNNSIENLFESDKLESQKIKVIDKWWSEYQYNKKQEEIKNNF